jgi:hypothetical protein
MVNLCFLLFFQGKWEGNSVMTGFQHVPFNTADSYNTLAALIYSALEIAGLPAHYHSIGSMRPGAEIEVDTGDDDAGGVYVIWRPSEQLSLAAAEQVRQGKLSDPVIEHSGSVKLVMRDAIITILASAGFSLQPSTDDMRPLAIQVRSGPAGASELLN